MIYLLVISVLIFIFAIARAGEKHKGTIALVAVLAEWVLSSWIAIGALTGSPFSKILPGGQIFGDIALRVDGLSAWFILLTNFTFVTGILYGRQYMKKYAGPECQPEPSLHQLYSESVGHHRHLFYTAWPCLHLCLGSDGAFGLPSCDL